MLSNLSIDQIEQMNEWGRVRKPFLFMFDFEVSKPILVPLDKAASEGIFFDVKSPFFCQQNIGSVSTPKLTDTPFYIKEAIPFEVYQRAFEQVHQHIAQGDSFLLNLTASTPIVLSASLQDVFFAAQAKCKVLFKDEFTCFSPEPFVLINKKGVISSYPMKGTAIQYSEADKTRLLTNQKELFEHTTIVDLIRNDISQVAEKVWVEKFRFIEEIQTTEGKTLLQISSQICGQLPTEWECQLGLILAKLLPAGSISGAPKPKTIEVIQKTEKQLHPFGERGYYTGIFGIFDGEQLYSSVMIRFIESNELGTFFKSGGGITFRSQVEMEYQELNDKIYVPLL
jgi:para-aminobenzoate synthetase component 1